MKLAKKDHEWTWTDLHRSKIAPLVERSTGGASNRKPTTVTLAVKLV